MDHLTREAEASLRTARVVFHSAYSRDLVAHLRLDVSRRADLEQPAEEPEDHRDERDADDREREAVDAGEVGVRAVRAQLVDDAPDELGDEHAGDDGQHPAREARQEASAMPAEMPPEPRVGSHRGDPISASKKSRDAPRTS